MGFGYPFSCCIRTVIKVATLNVHTVNTLVLVTRVLKVETLDTNVYKSQKGKLKR